MRWKQWTQVRIGHQSHRVLFNRTGSKAKWHRNSMRGNEHNDNNNEWRPQSTSGNHRFHFGCNERARQIKELRIKNTQRKKIFVFIVSTCQPDGKKPPKQGKKPPNKLRTRTIGTNDERAFVGCWLLHCSLFRIPLILFPLLLCTIVSCGLTGCTTNRTSVVAAV